MHDQYTEIATRFVSLVLSRSRKEWGETKAPSPEELQIFVDVVTAAGFKAKSVEVGVLTGDNRDQDGSATINKLCPCKVIDEDGGDYYFATGWLDCAFRCVVFGSERQTEEPEPLVEIVTQEIARSNPLEPIPLTPGGDMLVENHPSSIPLAGLGYFVEHYRDERVLRWLGIGIHRLCGGQIDIMHATETHDAIVCQSCHLRVPFPNGVTTYGELRQALASAITQPVA